MSSGEMLPSRSYDAGGGRAKTTIEEVFTQHSVTPQSVSAPWDFGWQMNERDLRFKDALHIRFKIGFVVKELNMDEEECEERLYILTELIPGLNGRLERMSPTVIAQLIQHSDTMAATLIQLKSIFPQADVGSLVMAQPNLAQSLDGVSASAKELRKCLPNSNVDHLVEKFPLLLDLEQLRESISLLEVLMPGSNFEDTLQKNPQLIFSLQKGKNMIPYDEVPTSDS